MRSGAVLASLLFVGASFGQIRSGAGAGGHAGTVLNPGGSYGAARGNVVFPGTGGSPVIANPGSRGLGTRPVGGAGYGRTPVTVRPGRTVVIPYAYPVVVGGYEGSYAQPPMEQQGQQYVAPPTVIINQTFVPDSLRPMVQDYPDGSLPDSPAQMKSLDGPMPRPQAPASSVDMGAAPDPKGAIYLIAYRDGSVYQAVGYWFQGDTLNYVTPKGNINRATMDLIDKDLSEQLNRERGVEFSLKR